MMIMPSDRDYKVTKSIKYGKRVLDSPFYELAQWIKSEFKVVVLNVYYDFIKPENRPRLNIVFEFQNDSAKLVLTPFMNCNVSYPIVIKIAPKGKHDFQAYFRISRKETKIKLGFDFNSVDKSFDLTNKNLVDINIFNRPEDKQTIIWADEKLIK